MGWGSVIWKKPIPDPVAKKALDPGSAKMHRALLNSKSSSFFLIHNTRIGTRVPGLRLMVYQPYTYGTYVYPTTFFCHLYQSTCIFTAPCYALLFMKYFQCFLIANLTRENIFSRFFLVTSQFVHKCFPPGPLSHCSRVNKLGRLVKLHCALYLCTRYNYTDLILNR